MLLVLLEHRARKMSRMEGRGAPMIFAAVGGGRLALFSRRRKCRRCCAFLESDMVLVVQVRSSVMCTPQEFSAADSLHSRAVMVSGGGQRSFS